MTYRILLVDDEPNTLSAIARSFHKEGFEIQCSTSAEQALEILSSEQIDLIISDQEMPGMKGTELLAEVYRNYPETIRFLLTGKATLHTAINAINRGAISRFFVKPCNMVELCLSIRQTLQQRDLMLHSRRLLQRVRHQSYLLQQIEQENPGITRIDREEDGSIVLDDIPFDYEAFINEIKSTLDDS